jgi:hypothetical protein
MQEYEIKGDKTSPILPHHFLRQQVSISSKTIDDYVAQADQKKLSALILPEMAIGVYKSLKDM